MKMSLIPLVVSSLVALIGPASVALGDEIRMTDGRVIEGEITSTPEAKDVDIKTRSGGMTAVMHLKAADIAKITYGQTAQQKLLAAFDSKRAVLTTSGGTAEQWWTLAEEGRTLGENVAVRQIAQRVIELDGDWAPARVMLGFVKQDSKWMKPAEAAAARGEVYFRGKWMQAAQRDGIVAEEVRIAKATAELTAQELATRAAELELAKKKAEVDAAHAAAAAAAAPAVNIYNTTTPGSSYVGATYSSGWGGNFGGGYYPPVVIYPPLCRPPVYRPPVYCPPVGCPPVGCPPIAVPHNSGSNFFFGATGQSNNTQWGVGIRN